MCEWVGVVFMRRLEVMRLQVVLLPFAWMSTLDAISYCLTMTI